MELNLDELLLLQNGLEQYGITPFNEVLSNFSTFIEELLFWNRKTNLVGTNDVKEIIVKHILDSLSIYPLLRRGILTILDIGSGAGFPALPLAIVNNRLKVTAVERRGKRAGFLRNVSNILYLNNFNVIQKDVREINISEKFDVVTARGFGELSLLYDLSKRHLKERAMIIAFKGRINEIEKEVSRLKEKVKDSDEIGIHIEKVKVPGMEEEERHLVIIETK